MTSWWLFFLFLAEAIIFFMCLSPMDHVMQPHPPCSDVLKSNKKNKWRVNWKRTMLTTQQRLSGCCWDEISVQPFFFCLSPQKSVISALLRTDKLIFFGYLVAKHYVFLITNQCNLCYECYVILRLAQVWSLPSPDRCPTSLTKFVCQIFAAHQVVWVHQSFFIEDRQLCKIMCQL